MRAMFRQFWLYTSNQWLLQAYNRQAESRGGATSRARVLTGG